uniref:Peptidase A1 domain-containing protein n=1 Tax=Quercus lobata TaxID=97700 RepID=A0A7N2LHD8_QUELO
MRQRVIDLIPTLTYAHPNATVTGQHLGFKDAVDVALSALSNQDALAAMGHLGRDAPTTLALCSHIIHSIIHLGEDNIYVYETDGRSVLLHINVPRFSFVYADSGSLNGLAKGTKGILGLGRTQIALPMQPANAFELKRKFALCVPSSTQSGLRDIFIGGGPYYMLPYTKNVSKLLITTPLIIDPVSTTPVYSEAVPTIDLLLQSKSVYWRIYGANSMVKVKKNLLCLGVVDGGLKPNFHCYWGTSVGG